MSQTLETYEFLAPSPSWRLCVKSDEKGLSPVSEPVLREWFASCFTAVVIKGSVFEKTEDKQNRGGDGSERPPENIAPWTALSNCPSISLIQLEALTLELTESAQCASSDNREDN